MNKPKYPWAELFDLESGIHQGQRANMGPGRPSNPVKRHHTSVVLTTDERRLFDELTYTLKMRIPGGKATKSQVLGLALRLLEEKIKSLPDQQITWAELAETIFEGE